MSDANELLNSLTQDEIAVYSADVSVEPHIIIGKDRHISVPEELRRIAVQFDHNIETVTFDCIRYWDEHDLSSMKIYINYIRADGGEGTFEAENITIDEVDDSIIHFTWTISRNATSAKGTLTIFVCAEKTDDNGVIERCWNTELNSEMTVSPGKKNAAVLDNVYTDILTQWKKSATFYFKGDTDDTYIYRDRNCTIKATKQNIVDASSVGLIHLCPDTDMYMQFLPNVISASEDYAMVGVAIFGDESAIMTTLYTREWL